MSLARTMRMALPRVMRSVVFKEPHKVQVEDRPVPTIQDPRDIVVKVTKSALCGRYVGCLLSTLFSDELPVSSISSAVLRHLLRETILWGMSLLVMYGKLDLM